MLRGLLVLSLFFLFCLGWPCQFHFGDNYYDLTPGNSNPNSTDGYLSLLFFFFFDFFSRLTSMFRFWTTSDINNDYYFKLCEETTSVPQGLSQVWAPSLHISLYLFSQKHQTTKQQCSAGTQVCQEDYYKHAFSCGVNPVTSAYETGSGKGVVMYASGGSSDGCTQGRQSYLEVLCPKGTGYSSGTFGPVTEQQACAYTFPFFHDVGCPTNSPINQSDGSFLFFFLFMIYSHTPKKNNFSLTLMV